MVADQPKYSVCITQYNDAPTLRRSIDAVLNQVDENFEVVVVDQRSTDGSRQILQEYADKGKIRLFDMRVRNRGLGRESAFEGSRGRYIISGMDTDDLAIPGRLARLLDFYHKRCEGQLLRLQWSGVVVAPAGLVRRVGGWRDAHWFENWDICERAARVGEYVWTIFRVKERMEPAPGAYRGLDAATMIRRNRARYLKYKEELRLGRRTKPIENGEKFGLGKGFTYLLASFSLLFLGRLNPVAPDFDECSPEYFVDSSEWWHGAGGDERQEITMYSKLLRKTPGWATNR